MIPGSCNYFDNYNGYVLTNLTNPPSSLSPLDGQRNPALLNWSSVGFMGAANASVMLDAGATPPTGTPPHGLPTPRFALVARGTIPTPRNTGIGIAANVRQNLFFATPTSPVVISQDIFLTSPDTQPRTLVWWSPVSFDTGSIFDRIFFGGTNLQGDLAGFSNGQGVTDRFLSLGRFPSGIGEVFYGSASTPLFQFPVNSWFTMMLHVNVDGYSVWIKTAETAALNPPLLDPRMSVGDIVPIDGNPVGWVNTYPGRGDNLATPMVREGIGIARNRFGDLAPFTGSTQQAPLFAGVSFDGIQYGWGFDNPNNPSFQPSDYAFANLCIRGEFVPIQCPPDINRDGVVNGSDLLLLLNEFGDDLAGFTEIDLNSDGFINGTDLLLMLNAWGPCL